MEDQPWSRGTVWGERDAERSCYGLTPLPSSSCASGVVGEEGTEARTKGVKLREEGAGGRCCLNLFVFICHYPNLF